MFVKQSALTYAEYLGYEQFGSVKHEFVNSQRFAIARTDAHHNLIVCNLVAALHSQLRVTSYRLFALDMRLTIASANNATYYPDVMVVGDRADNDLYVMQSPCLVMEVMSSFTAVLDRREKLFNYQQLESLQEYVLISQSEVMVELYRKDRDGVWWVKSLRLGESLDLRSIDFAIALSEIYEDVEL